MRTFTSFDGITIKVGEDAKDNDILTESSYPKEWWLHVADLQVHTSSYVTKGTPSPVKRNVMQQYSL